jgi:peptidyl-dipeptidase A
MRTKRERALMAVVMAGLAAAAASFAAAPADVARDEPQRFLDLYSSLFQRIFYVSEQAGWAASTDVTPEHDGGRVAADKALAAFVGDPQVIAEVRRLRSRADLLTPLQSRQLDRILLQAAEYPGTIPDVVAKRVEAESRQSSTLDGFTFCLERGPAGCAKPITANEIDDTLRKSRDLDERRRVWEVSKQSGVALRPGLEDLQRLRNAVAREMGYSSFYGLQVADYGMTVPEMMAMLDGFLRDIDPLYRELHCYAKRRLASRYHQPVPKRIPAHWLDNRWSQHWPGIVEGIDYDPLFKGRSAEWIVKQAEAFYVSMGFPKLPPVFWEKSDLYPVPKGSDRKKNTHASAWHLNLADDMRSLQSVEPNAEWFATAHHELGHIYYYLSYTRPEVPVLLREGANRGFHEGVGELISIAAMQTPYLKQVGVMPADQNPDRIAVLLDEALDATVPFLVWGAGTMSHWEHDLYEENLPPSQWNKRWWDDVLKFQGVDPPAPRGEEFCDPATKTHINDDPGQYYDYAVATVLKYQLHEHIARAILKQDPRSCNYYGSVETGAFLRSILEKGATEDWRKVIREATGSDLSTKPMLDYFAPLLDYLKKENAGQTCSWE